MGSVIRLTWLWARRAQDAMEAIDSL